MRQALIAELNPKCEFIAVANIEAGQNNKNDSQTKSEIKTRVAIHKWATFFSFAAVCMRTFWAGSVRASAEHESDFYLFQRFFFLIHFVYSRSIELSICPCTDNTSILRTWTSCNDWKLFYF